MAGQKKSLSSVVAFLLLLGTITVTAPSLQGQPSENTKEPPPTPVEAAKVVKRQIVPRITLVGTAEPWLETVVASEESGKVRKMMVEEGDLVKKNQDLCVQDSTQLDLKIEAARANLAEAEVLHAQAQREYERQKKLFAINSVAEKAYEDARTMVEASEKKLARYRADLLTLEDQLKKRNIKAPVSGYVVKRYCLVGQWLGEGEPVATLVVADPIRVRVPVPERYVAGITKGAGAEVTFDALPGRSFKGKISAIIPRAVEDARTFPVRIQISNPDGSIKAGMLGRATLPVGKAHWAVLVPKDALVLSDRGKVVFVITGETVQSVPVTTGSAHGSLIEVTGDIKEGQEVVSKGNERLRPGQAIRVVNTAGSH